jgi:uncharacterized protein (TIGR02246 family)
MAGVGATAITPLDEQAIQAVVTEYGSSWNRHDISAMADLFTDDAHWVNIVGWHWSGKSAVVNGHEAIHHTFFQTTDIKLVVVEIRMAASDVAVAVVLLMVCPFTPPDGVRRPGSRLF